MTPRELLSAARSHWRITLLVALLAVSLFIVLAPVDGLQPDHANQNMSGDDPIEQDLDSGPTNLQWGLQLSGGTSVRAPIDGYIVHDLSIDEDAAGELPPEIAGALNVSEGEVHVRTTDAEDGDSVETTAPNVSEEAFATALSESGLDVDVDDVEEGVHEETRESIRQVIQDRIDGVGLGGANVDVLTRPTGEQLITIDVPNVGQEEVLRIISERGEVEVLAHFPEENGNETTYRNESVLGQNDFGNVDPAVPSEGDNPPHVPVVVESGHAQTFADDMTEYGFGESTGTNCAWDVEEGRPDDPGHCLVTVVDGEVIYAAGVSPNLADSFRTGTFVDQPDFIMETSEFVDAQDLSINLRSGALPADLDIDDGTIFFLQPSLADEFRYFSLIVGIVAALSVAGMVYWRYRDARVAVPMLLTASAEVVILLAFAVIVPIPLDLAHIAGFIAVLGTGVDDLVIIADEIMQRGDIQTDRVFESRFRKAFWVIGVAAATTILAMTPLVALSLGELTGFAIVTIIGVLVGVLITRPAYGDILRVLLLD